MAIVKYIHVCENIHLFFKIFEEAYMIIFYADDYFMVFSFLLGLQKSMIKNAVLIIAGGRGSQTLKEYEFFI